jgi:hypothetical protein
MLGAAVRRREFLGVLKRRERGPFVADGGLMSYAIDVVDLFRRSASYVDRILKGENPGDLPVQAPTKFELILNLRTAKFLDLDVSPYQSACPSRYDASSDARSRYPQNSKSLPAGSNSSKRGLTVRGMFTPSDQKWE